MTGAAGPDQVDASIRVVALVGLRATGKTTLGKALAAALGWAFADGDDLLAARVGAGAGEFLRRAGEPAFRAVEREVLLPALARASHTVLATGGGAVEQDDVRRALAAPDVFTVWLRAEPELLLRRLLQPGPDRPPLTDLPPDRELSWLAERRAPWFAAVADLQIDTGASPPAACLHRVLAALRGPRGSSGSP